MEADGALWGWCPGRCASVAGFPAHTWALAEAREPLSAPAHPERRKAAPGQVDGRGQALRVPETRNKVAGLQLRVHLGTPFHPHHPPPPVPRPGQRESPSSFASAGRTPPRRSEPFPAPPEDGELGSRAWPLRVTSSPGLPCPGTICSLSPTRSLPCAHPKVRAVLRAHTRCW